MAQSVVTNSGVATIGRALNLVMGVAVTAISSRLLGATGYGIYVLLFSFTSIIQMMADFGLYLHLARALSRQTNSDKQQEIIGHTLAARIVLLLASFGLVAAATAIFPELRHNMLALGLMVLGMACQSLSQLMMGIFQARAVVWRATIGDIAGRIIQVVGLGIIWYYWQRAQLSSDILLQAIVSMFAGSTIVSLTIYYLWLPTRHFFTPLFNRSGITQVMLSSWPLALLLFLNAIYFRIDSVLLAWLRSPQEVGWYGLAYRIIESALFFPAMFGGLLLPILSKAYYQKQADLIRRVLGESITGMLVVACFVIIAAWFEAGQAVQFLSGAAFLPSGHLLTILSIALVAMLFGNIFGFSLVAFDRQTYLLYLYAALIVVNVAGNLWAIPRFGAIGAAWMTVITEIVSMGSAAVLVYRLFPAKFDSWQLVRLLGVAITTWLVWSIFPASWHAIVRLAVGALWYVGANVAVGVIRQKSFPLLTTRPV